MSRAKTARLEPISGAPTALWALRQVLLDLLEAAGRVAQQVAAHARLLRLLEKLSKLRGEVRTEGATLQRRE